MASLKNSRDVAVKVAIQDILGGTFVLEPEQESNYLLSKDNHKLYRINVMATILEKEELGSITNFMADDGSGRIIARFFEKSPRLASITIGDTVLIIGKVRVYNAEKYISPEIIRNADVLWLKVRKLELPQKAAALIANESHPQAIEPVAAQEAIEQEMIEDATFPAQKVLGIIKKLDQGSGVHIEEIIKESPIPNAESIIEKMIQRGDIFQISPGKVKIL